MGFVVAQIKWILLVSGVLTFTMVKTVVAPHRVMGSFFGETLEGAAAEIVMRSWGALIALGGALLVYAAFHPESRPLACVLTGVGKLAFIALVLAHGGRYLDDEAGIAVVADSLMVLLFAAYLVGSRSQRAGARTGA